MLLFEVKNCKFPSISGTIIIKEISVILLSKKELKINNNQIKYVFYK